MEVLVLTNQPTEKIVELALNNNLTGATLEQSPCDRIERERLYSNLDLSREKHGKLISMRNMNIKNVSFAGANLESCLLLDSRFNRVHFQKTKLRNTHGTGANFCNTSFLYSDFSDANFVGNETFFSSCNFYRSVINKANFSGTTFINCKFNEVVGSDVNFSHCRFINCSFEKAKLPNVDFWMASAQGCRFYETVLQRGNLQKGDFRGSVFNWANLKDCNLTEALFTGSNMFGADLSGCKVFGSYLDFCNLLGSDLMVELINGFDMGCYSLRESCVKESKFHESTKQEIINLGGIFS